MKITPLSIPDVLVLQPNVYTDNRGFFMESFNLSKFCEAIGRQVTFVQDNQSFSTQGVLRGLHYQINHAQGKLVRVTVGEVFDVAVDLREYSPTYGKWVGEFLSDKNNKQLWIPEGFAHGFLVMSENAQFHYKVTDYWSPADERCIVYNDPQLAIQWPEVNTGYPIVVPFLVSDKDNEGSLFSMAEIFKK
jgi:dTDP-4-dehydrorhamnose 3,5-epimerase